MVPQIPNTKFFNPDNVSGFFPQDKKNWIRFNETEEFKKNYSNASVLLNIFKGVREGITFYNQEPESRITLINERVSFLTGYDSNDLVRRPIIPYLVPEKYANVIYEIKQSERMTSPYDIEIFTKEKNIMPITIIGAPTFNLENNRIGSMLLMNNDSQVFMKNLEFLSGFIHDMRNFITIAIIGSYFPPNKLKELKTWLDSESNNPLDQNVKITIKQICDSLEKTSKASKNMNYLISGLYSFINREKQECKNFSLKGSVLSSISLFKGTRDYKLRNSIFIEYKGEENIIINGHEGNFQSILLNLMLNAVKEFTDEKGNKISISWDLIEDEKIRILVTNNGPRIKDNIVESLFKERVQSTHMGSGIGLMNVKSMLENFNGSISLKETNEEQTVFEIIVEGRRGSSLNH